MDYIKEFAPYWECNKCNDISDNIYLCGSCKKGFRCTKCFCTCDMQFTNESDQYMMCLICGSRVRTIVGMIPDEWESVEEGDKKYLQIRYTNISDDEETVRRGFKMKFNFTGINPITNIDGFLENLPKPEFEGSCFILTNEELCFLYSSMIIFGTAKPVMCNCINCFMRKTLIITNFSSFVLENLEHTNVNQFNQIMKYLKMYWHQPPTINSINNVLNQSMEEDVVTFSATNNVVHKIKESSIKHKDVKNEINDKMCTICFEEYTDECNLSRLTCCGKYLHTDCIVKWFTEYGHKCPLCQHQYEHNEDPIPSNSSDEEHDSNSSNEEPESDTSDEEEPKVHPEDDMDDE